MKKTIILSVLTILLAGCTNLTGNIDIPATSPTVVSSTPLLSFNNSNFPGLTFKYDNSWQLLYKNFANNIETYDQNCSQNCSGVKLAQNNNSLVFDIEAAADNNSLKCTNNAAVTISSSWYRFDNERMTYVPAVNVRKNYKVTQNDSDAYSSQDNGDGWSVIMNKTYNYCIVGEGAFLKDTSKGQLLMTFPLFQGSDFSKADSIIQSITGI